jgi:hypothetical protein
MTVELVVEDLQLVVDVRISERRAQEEAVELRFGQRKRPVLLDRVLGRDQQERNRQAPRYAVDRDLRAGRTAPSGARD